jgi:TctA family transporter
LKPSENGGITITVFLDRPVSVALLSLTLLLIFMPLLKPMARRLRMAYQSNAK